MGLIFTPSSLTFRSLVGNSSTKSVELSSEGFLFNGFTSTPGRSFTVTDAVIKHLHNGVVFTEGVSYYVQPNGSISETLSTCLIGIGNSTGGLNLTFKRLLIDSLNNGDPFYFVGEFLEGVHYFFSSAGDKIVPASDPDITPWYAGIGNADGDIDLDIKQLHIYDVVSPNNVQLDVAFNVTGSYVLLGGKIVVDAYNGSSWIKISTGEYVQCAGGTFTIPVTLPSASFGVNTVPTVRCYDYETYGLNGSDTSNIISTVTITNITEVTAGVAKTIGGSFNGTGATVKYKLHSEPTVWTTAGSATVDTGTKTWSYSLTIPTADRYDVGVFDSTNPDGFAVQESIAVASASLKIQILSENCDFEPFNSVSISGSEKIAIVGKLDNFSAGTKKLGGYEISVSSYIMTALVLYNITTKTVEWVRVSSFVNANATVFYYPQNIVEQDGTYIYWLCSSGIGEELKRVRISDGDVTNISVAIGGYSDVLSYSSMCQTSDYIFIMSTGASYYKQYNYGFRVEKSTLAVSTVKLTPFAAKTSGTRCSIATDGTYIYWYEVSYYATERRTLIVRSDLAIANQTTYLEIPPHTANNYMWINKGIYANGKAIIQMNECNSSWVLQEKWLYDETNEISPLIFGNIHTAGDKLLHVAGLQLYRHSLSDLSTVWGKNYSSEIIDNIIKVVKTTTNYYIVGRTTGNFDGNSPSNTRKCAIIGKISIENGDL